MTLKHPVSLVVSASTLDITPGLSDGDTPLYVFTPDSGSTISGLVTTTVTLDSGSYGASLTVTGSILAASSDGVDGSTAGISLLNQGIIVGATANGQYDYYTRYYVYNGGAGVDFTAAGTVTNDGTITGGNSFSDSQNFGVYGGFGILLTGAGAVTNTGIVTGGNGSYGVIEGGTGGAGVRLEGDAMLSNMGTIQGGAGGFTTNGYAGGNGGLGVRCGLGGFVTTLMNAGTILGGIVGQATASNAYQFGGGGVAALNAYVLNTGTIQGGAGNATSAGGNGVELYGGTLVNAGTISAGSGVPGDRNGEAVRLYGEYKETLVVDPGAVFNGQVEVVYHFGHDAETLDLAGTTAATLTGIGTQFTGFTNIGFDTGAQWTLEGTTAALAGGQTIAGFTGGDTIVLDGFVETSETYVAGTGVVLSNGSTSLTLALTGANPADKFAVSTYGGNTSIGLLASAPAVSTISTAVATAVMLGSPAYTATLTVTGTGSITPAGAYGGAGVYGDVAGVSLLNSGAITGGAGLADSNGYGGTGGDGVQLTAGSVTNDGTITGGIGGAGHVGAAGGNGVDLSNATLANGGTIYGGQGGADINNGIHVGYSDNIGGAGVYLQAGALLTNTGAITGGEGGGAGFGYRPAYGGSGIEMTSGASVNNQGTVTGGTALGGGSGGAGIYLAGGGALTNSATIIGGTGGAASSTYTGGSGGSGLVFISDGTVTNTGLIQGGQGGHCNEGGIYAGQGGAGVRMGGGTLTNAGTIVGGMAGYAPGMQAPAGGDGIFCGGGSIINTGTITGGPSVAYPGTYNRGAAGVLLESGATLTNAGTISGGPGLNGNGIGYAVELDEYSSNTVIVDPGAVFNGEVDVSGYSEDKNNVLELAGTKAASFTGLGTQFSGFTTLLDAAGSKWTLKGANTLSGNASVAIYGNLRLPGKLIDGGGSVTIAQGGQLRAGGHANLLAGSLVLQGGTVLEAANPTITIGERAQGGMPGEILVKKNAAITGYGSIAGVGSLGIVDDGAITASGGTLSLGFAVSGTGTLAIDDGASVVAKLGLSVASLAFEGAGTLALGTPAAITTPISGFAAGDTIDLDYLKVKSVSFVNDTLTLIGKGNLTLGTLIFTGDYATANFTLTPDGHNGTDLGFTATPAAADFVPSLVTNVDHGITPDESASGWHAQNPLGPVPDWLTLHHSGW